MLKRQPKSQPKSRSVGGNDHEQLLAAFAVGVPEPALRYGIVARFADAAAGRRDARSDLHRVSSASAATPEAPMVWQLWLARTTHTFLERDHREFLAAQAAAAPAITTLQRLRAERSHAEAVAQASGRRHEAMPSDVPQEALTPRGPAERLEELTAIEARRRDAHERTLRQAAAAAEADANNVKSLTEALRRVSSELESLFAIARIRSDRLREYTSRRASTYVHAYLKVAQRRVSEPRCDLPTEADAVIESPAWTQLPCPWTAGLRDQW